jgi:hypothetical protein
MNLHYGPLTALPFDLSHKVAPCRYRLPPNASKAEIATQKTELTAQFVEALRLHIKRVAAQVPVAAFQATLSTTTKAFFWQPGDLLARIGGPHPFRHDQDDTVEYRFNDPLAFYLRLMPTVPPRTRFDITKLTDIVDRQRLQVMTQTRGHRIANRNQYGAIALEPHGTATNPAALSQLFRNGEIWGVSREFVSNYLGRPVIPMISLEKALMKVLESYIDVARDELGIEPPYDIEIGAVGLKDMSLSLPQRVGSFANQTSGPILEDQLIYRRTLTATTPKARHDAIHEFIRQLYDTANVVYQVPEGAQYFVT